MYVLNGETLAICVDGAAQLECNHAATLRSFFSCVWHTGNHQHKKALYDPVWRTTKVRGWAVGLPGDAGTPGAATTNSLSSNPFLPYIIMH